MLIFTTPLFSFASPLFALKARYDPFCLDVLLHEVGRVQVVLEPYEVLLDAARRHEAVEDRDRARLVVGATRARTSEWLLADNGARALLVVVDVAGRVAQTVGRLEQRLAFRGETVCEPLVSVRGKYKVCETHT